MALALIFEHSLIFLDAWQYFRGGNEEHALSWEGERHRPEKEPSPRTMALLG